MNSFHSTGSQFSINSEGISSLVENLFCQHGIQDFVVLGTTNLTGQRFHQIAEFQRAFFSKTSLDMWKLKNAAKEKVVRKPLLSIVEVNFAENIYHEFDFIWRQNRQALASQNSKKTGHLGIANWFIPGFATIYAH